MNMGYCRFENTAQDLQECVDNWYDHISDTEDKAQDKIIELAREIVAIEGEK